MSFKGGKAMIITSTKSRLNLFTRIGDSFAHDTCLTDYLAMSKNMRLSSKGRYSAIKFLVRVQTLDINFLYYVK